MLPPIQKSLSRPCGDSVAIVAPVVEDAFGAPVADATGWRLVVSVKNAQTDADSAALIMLDSSSQTICGNAIRQVIETAGLTVGARLFYDARFIDPAGRVFTYCSGILLVEQPVTASPGNVTPVSLGGVIPGARPVTFTSAVELTATVTAGKTRNVFLTGTINGVLTTVQLIAGTETGDGYFRPDDFNADTNACVWVQLQ